MSSWPVRWLRSDEPARDATFDVSCGTPRVVPSSTGRGVDDESLADGVMAAIESSERSATLELERVEPDLTTAEAKDLGVTEQIASYTQVFPYAAYRVTNIGLASDKINGTVLEPGETFSLNGIVGERTPENGFVEGLRHSGGRLVEDYGGAVSTITTAMWHTAFYAGMTRIEQRAHGFWISRYIAWARSNRLMGLPRPEVPQRHSVRRPRHVFAHRHLGDDDDVEHEVLGHRRRVRSARELHDPGTIYDTGPECVRADGRGRVRHHGDAGVVARW